MKIRALACLSFALAATANAYEKDTHYELTYYICRLACFSHAEAATIASADAGIDECSETDPSFLSLHNSKWHALCDDEAEAKSRRDVLWNEAVGGKNLVYLGRYFHFQQDVYSHAKSFNNKDDFEPYGPLVGHAVELRQADRPPAHVTRAYEMAKETLARAKEFLRLMGRTPSDFPESEMITLVDTQCKQYERGAILDMWEEVDPDKVGEALGVLCDKWLSEQKIKKVIRKYPWSRRIPIEFGSFGTVMNDQQFFAAVKGIVDYNTIDGPPAPPPTEGYQPPVTPVNTGVPDDRQVTERDSREIVLHSQTLVSLELVPVAGTTLGVRQWCYSACLGKIHPSHGVCDRACDAPCQIRHGADTMRAKVTYDPIAVIGLLPEFDQSLQKAGTFSVARAAIDTKIDDYLQTVQRYEVHTPSEHWSKPCTQELRNFPYRRYNLKAKVTVVTDYTVDGGDKKTERKESEAIVGTVEQPDVWNPEVVKLDPHCFCVSETATPSVPAKGKTPTETTPAPGPQNVVPGANPNIVPELHVTGRNMNEITFATDDPMAHVYIPAGSALVPTDRSYQTMMVVGGGWVGGTPTWSAGPGPIFEPTALRVNCLEIEKKAPNPAVSYKIVRTDDPILRRIALFVESENFQGPWDQARTWVYLDRSPLETINARLIPPIPGGQYARCLYELSEFANVNVRASQFSSLLKPAYLLEKGNTRDGIRWLVKELATSRREDLRGFFNQKWIEYVKGVDPNKDDDLDRIAYVVRGMESGSSPLLRDAEMRTLSALSPTARATVLRRARLR